MNYTTNYHLPQWVESDRILMGDFNDAMETLDGGIAAAKAAADTAKTTAETAQSAAETAQSSADAVANAYTPNNKPYVVGSFTGNGSEMTITLGFRPSFLIITGQHDNRDAMSVRDFAYDSGITGENNLTKRLQLTDTGFILKEKSSENYSYPDFTEAYRKYEYIAFR